MPKSPDALVNPELLEWARESAGMSREEAARRMQLSESRLYAWEEGVDCPTIKQLRSLANIYKQSLAAFYLPKPPKVFKPPLHDYRRLPDAGPAAMSSDLVVEIREAIARRSLCLELYADSRQKPPSFSERVSADRDPETVGERLRQLLEISLDDQRAWKGSRAAFNAWREAAERKGVLVFQSRESQLSEMRGYSIADFPLPILVVNRKDAPAGRIFTLLHELTHLMLRSAGLCDLDTRPNRSPADQRVEVFCNHVAGAALVPRQAILAHPTVRSHGAGPIWQDDELATLANHYRVSRDVVLRRLLIMRRTSESFYEKKYRQLQQLHDERSKTKKEGHIAPADDAVSAAGKTFVKLVIGAYHDDRLTTSDVSDYLGIKLKHLDRISELVGMS